jgi:hypothetical protein
VVGFSNNMGSPTDLANNILKPLLAQNVAARATVFDADTSSLSNFALEIALQQIEIASSTGSTVGR